MNADSSFNVQTPLLENMVVGVPPVFEGLTKQIHKIVEQPLLGPKSKFPAGKTTNMGFDYMMY
jgi:tubulin gamma